ncbi:hypothetical protein LINPERHAP1_LOCUS25917 [Linum perenne]
MVSNGTKNLGHPRRNENAPVVLDSSSVFPQFLGQCSQEIVHENPSKRRAIPNCDTVRLNYDGFLLLDQQRVPNRAVVIEDRPNEHIRISRFHNLPTEAGAYSTPVRPNEVRKMLLNQPFG